MIDHAFHINLTSFAGGGWRSTRAAAAGGCSKVEETEAGGCGAGGWRLREGARATGQHVKNRQQQGRKNNVTYRSTRTRQEPIHYLKLYIG